MKIRFATWVNGTWTLLDLPAETVNSVTGLEVVDYEDDDDSLSAWVTYDGTHPDYPEGLQFSVWENEVARLESTHPLYKALDDFLSIPAPGLDWDFTERHAFMCD